MVMRCNRSNKHIFINGQPINHPNRVYRPIYFSVSFFYRSHGKYTSGGRSNKSRKENSYKTFELDNFAGFSLFLSYPVSYNLDTHSYKRDSRIGVVQLVPAQFYQCGPLVPIAIRLPPL